MKTLKVLAAAVAVAVLLPVAANDASANLITHEIDGNDCSGYFGTGFEACTIFGFGEDDEKVELSPVIAKYDFNDDGTLTSTETNSLYPSITGDEFSWTGANTTSGTWSYTPDANDPGVRYWVAKGGNSFLLHWFVSNAAIANGGACENPTFFNLSCLNEAQVVTSGNWSTPGGKGLSHLTFYDTAPVQVPEPATLGMLGLGLLGMAALRRRKLGLKS